MSKQYPECPLSRHDACKDYYNPKLCAIVRKDKNCLRELSKNVKRQKPVEVSEVEALGKGDKVSLIGFGTFKVAERKARKGRNPQTGEEIDIAASKVPKFVAGKALKEAVK